MGKNMGKNKGDAGNIAGITNLANELTMNKYTPNNQKFQPKIKQSRRDLLEQTKLSHFLPDLSPSAPTTVGVCAGCGGRLDRDDNFQQSVKVCRKCLVHYAKIDAAIDEASKRKRRELLGKLAGGAE